MSREIFCLPDTFHKPWVQGLVVILKVNPTSKPLHNELENRGGEEWSKIIGLSTAKPILLKPTSHLPIFGVSHNNIATLIIVLCNAHLCHIIWTLQEKQPWAISLSLQTITVIHSYSYSFNWMHENTNDRCTILFIRTSAFHNCTRITVNSLVTDTLVSGQLHLRTLFSILVFTSQSNSVFTHSRKRTLS